MVYFLIGVPKISGNVKESQNRVNTSIASHGELYSVDLDLTRFKLGNFDNMMLNYESVAKIEAQVEGLIKRIQKSYLDIEPKADLQKMVVESKDLGPGRLRLKQSTCKGSCSSSVGTIPSTPGTKTWSSCSRSSRR